MRKPYSYHIFLFPFRWDFCKKNNNCENKRLNFSESINLKKFEDLLIPNKEDTNWNTEKYKTDNAENYNEYTYFYDFVRDAIFETNKKGIEKHDYKNKIMKHYSYNTNFKNYKYEISVLDGKTYKLDIKEIYLHVYSTGVALLSYHLENNETSKFDDILKINDFGRRFFPSFLFKKNEYISKAKKSSLANSISISKDNKNIITEDFEYYNNIDSVEKNVFNIPKFIQEILGSNFIANKDNKKNDSIKIASSVDDRMFVISWFGDNVLINKLNKKDNINEYHFNNMRLNGNSIVDNKYNYLTNYNWYKYLFIDNENAMCQNMDMLEELNKNHSYTRFIDWSTLYGVSRYSFVCLTSDLETLKKNNADFIPVHIKTMYYQMIVLSLMQRASVLRFSQEVTEISKLDDDDTQLKEIKQINKAYLEFRNSMYFREVTAQEQGIELYDMIQEHMRIERDVKDLNREIDELYQFAKLLEDEKERDKTNKHTWLATFFLPVMLISGILGMNIWDKSKEIPQFLFGGNFVSSFWIPTIIVLIPTIFFTKTHIIIWKWLKAKLKKQ